MKFDTIQFIDKLGREVCLRNAEESDAAALIDYLTITTAETPYLIREPEEVTITLEQEKSFIQRTKDAERELLLIAEIDGKHIGNCSLMNIAPPPPIFVTLSPFSISGMSEQVVDSSAIKMSGKIFFAATIPPRRPTSS